MIVIVVVTFVVIIVAIECQSSVVLCRSLLLLEVSVERVAQIVVDVVEQAVLFLWIKVVLEVPDGKQVVAAVCPVDVVEESGRRHLAVVVVQHDLKNAVVVRQNVGIRGHVVLHDGAVRQKTRALRGFFAEHVGLKEYILEAW